MPGETYREWPEARDSAPATPSSGRSSVSGLNKGTTQRICGFANWEWEVEAGLCIFSPEWDNILLSSEYASIKPHDPNWWWERIHEDDIPDVRETVRRMLEGLVDSFDMTFRIQRGDGCWAWLVSRGAVSEKKADGTPAVISGVIMDVSQLRTDAKFQHGTAGVGDACYHAMLENSPDMYVRMDRELFPLYINPVVAGYMGRERGEYTYTDTLDELGIETKQLEFLKKNIARVYDEGVAVREMVSFRAPTGEQVTGEYSFWPEFDTDGKVRFAMTHFRDLTEQTRIAERARLNERRLTALYQLTQMDNAPERQVLDFLMNSLLKLTNSASGFIFIPEGKNLEGKGLMLWSDDHYQFLDEKVLVPDTLHPDLVRMLTGADGRRHYRALLNGDGTHPVHVSFGGQMPVMRYLAAPGTEGGRIACIAGVCNKESNYEESDLQQLEIFVSGAWLILRRRRHLEELMRAKEAAEHANKVKDEFLANVSHELRTPLNGMLSMLQLLDFSSLSDQQREYSSAASLSGKALLRILSDILDFSRMESGKMQLQSEHFDLKAAIRSTMQLFVGEAKRKNLAFTSELDEFLPDCIQGDESRVRQILFNLVGNALKFTDEGSIKISCSLLPAQTDGKIRVYIAIADTGIGIPREKQSMIFEAFTQVDSSTTRKYGGTGLGLSIVRRLVEMMGGSVSVESELGKGTTIHCSLIFDRSEQGTVRPAVTASIMPGPVKSLDILVAEDDDVSRFAIRSLLLRAGHRPVCVGNGRQALEALKLHDFHCLFTDIQMPDMDGLELAARIRARRSDDIAPSEEVAGLVQEIFPKAPWGLSRSLRINSDIAIVAVSAHAMAGDKERFLERGVNHYISKPIVMEELAEVLALVSSGCPPEPGRPVRG